ncbi:ACP S-malonyltransferase [Buchananella felis]|uniref:ACP S-malonyltransferase n=1 Tax=Buchananella felis TaxID=3231492 RepID=UPI0035288140
MIVVQCPGQGAQSPGMLSAWLDEPGREFLTELSEAAGLDLVELGTTATAEQIKNTAFAQPLIVAAGLLAWRALGGLGEQRSGLVADVALVAGHSVGEITAAAVAGSLSPADAVRLAAARGAAMAAAAEAGQTGMSAVVGGDPAEVIAAIETAGAHPANLNGPGQIVAAGERAALEALAANPPAKARVIALEVHGAFHSPAMVPAVAPVKEALAALELRDPTIRLLSNRGGATLSCGADVAEGIAHQITSTVDWTACCQQMSAAQPELLVELAPAGVLTRIAKRAVPGVRAVAVNSPADAAALIEEKK